MKKIFFLFLLSFSGLLTLSAQHSTNEEGRGDAIQLALQPIRRDNDGYYKMGDIIVK